MSPRLLAPAIVIVFAGLTPFSSHAQTRIDPSRAADAVTIPGGLRREAPLPGGVVSDDGISLAPSTPGDQDIGQQVLLEGGERYKAFTLWLDSAAFWTDNAANVNEGAREDWFYVGGVTLAWQPRITDRIYFDSYIDQHWYRYDSFDALDYEVAEGGAGLMLAMPELWNSLWHLRYYYERVTQDIDSDPVYQAHSLHFGAQKSISLSYRSRIDLALYGSAALDTEPSVLARHEYALAAGWNYKITREIALILAYRLSYYDYYNLAGREDWYQNFGVSLVWQPRPWCELAASYNYSLNTSNLDAFDYQAHLAGPSVRLTIKF
jgi:hypothetical protein